MGGRSWWMWNGGDNRASCGLEWLLQIGQNVRTLSVETGVTHTGGGGVTHTGRVGLSHTDFVAVCVGSFV